MRTFGGEHFHPNSEGDSSKPVPPFDLINNGAWGSIIYPLLKAIFLFEPFNSATFFGKQLLGSSIKRVALGTNFYPNLRLCGASFDCITACTLHYTILVFRMDSLFHALHLSYPLYPKSISNSTILDYTTGPTVLQHSR